jgi:5-methylcytosine-specific restriction endonuclease McrA
MFNPQPRKRKERNKGNRVKCKKRDKKCVYCDCKHSLNAHHIISKSQGGGDELYNLITLCFKCHRAYHDGFIPKELLLQKVNNHFKTLNIMVQYTLGNKKILRDKDD